MFQTFEEQNETLRWAVLATHLNGAADSGKYDQVDSAVILRHVQAGDVFEFFRRELGAAIEGALARLTDVRGRTKVLSSRLYRLRYSSRRLSMRLPARLQNAQFRSVHPRSR